VLDGGGRGGWVVLLRDRGAFGELSVEVDSTALEEIIHGS